MHRRSMVVANWKMHTTLAEAVTLARRVSQSLEGIDDVDVVLLPPVIWLPSILESLTHRPGSLGLGVQNFYPEAEGAFTGEIGTTMLQRLAKYVLIGHSERRVLFAETDKLIHDKLQAALTAGLYPILCVGELEKVMLADRGRGRPTVTQRESNILRQLEIALDGVHGPHIERLIVCYEPLWAIGTGDNVPGSHVQAVLEQLRTFLTDQYGALAASRMRLLYGGSVTGKTIQEYTRQPDIDGVLVGGASLSIREFEPILRAVAEEDSHALQALHG